MFLPDKSTSTIWNAFLVCWVATYIGYPDKIRLDQDSVFKSNEFTSLTKSAGIEIQLSGVHSHNALGNGERYHSPLRRIFLKIIEDVPDLDWNIALQLSIKAMNDTTGPDDLVPSLLVFGAIPRFPPQSTPLLSHEDRMRAMNIARLEMAVISAELKIRRALREKVPPATDYFVSPEDSFYVWNEGTKQWRGHFTVTRTFQRNVWVKRPDTEAQYSLDHVLPFTNTDGMGLLSHIHHSLSGMSKHSNTESFRVYLTEVLKPGDRRGNDPRFDAARLKEIKGLLDRNIFEVLLRDELPTDANILGGRFVLSIKNKNTEKEL